MSRSYPERSAARLYAVQALFQMEAADQGWEVVRDQFLSHRFGATLEEGEFLDGDIDLFTTLLEKVVDQQSRIDQATNEVLDKAWPIHRIDPILRAIFRAAAAEYITNETPKNVVIDEYVELAKSFASNDKQSKFTNGVLEALSHSIALDH